MRTVKNLSLVLMTAMIAVFMTACGGGNSPKTTAKNFLDALSKQDFNGAKQYATEGSAQVLDMIATMSSMSDSTKQQEAKKGLFILKIR